MTDNSSGEGMAWLKGLGLGVVMVGLIVGAFYAGHARGVDQEQKKLAKTSSTQKQKSGQASKPAAKPAPAAKPVPAGPGKALFAQRCGGCHTLAAAATQGKVGPNLNQLKPDVARVLAAIKKGGATATVMPKGLASGAQAQQIADFVAKTSAP